MKLTILLTFIICFLSYTNSFAKECPDPACDDPVSKAIKEVAKKEEEDFIKMTQEIIVEDKSLLEECLSGIGGFGLNIGLNIPSIDDLMNQACKALQSQANKRIEEIKGKFTLPDTGGILTTGSSGNSIPQINVTDISPQIIKRLEGIILEAGKR